MILQDIVEKVTSDFRGKALPVSIFLGTHAADDITTILGAYKYGASAEWIPFARYFMEKFGPVHGTLIADAIGVPIALMLINSFSKSPARPLSPKSQKMRTFMEHLPFYLFSAVNVGIVANNIAVYYSGPV